MRNRISRVRKIVSNMTKEEVAKEIKDLEAALTTQNIVVKYNLDNNIELLNYIYKTNVLSEIVQAFRLVAHEQGKLESSLYA